MYFLEQHTDTAVFCNGEGMLLRIGFITPAIVRVTYTERGFPQNNTSRIVVASGFVPFNLAEEDDCFRLSTSAMTVVVQKRTGAIAYFAASRKLLVQEPDRGGKWLTSKQVYRNIFSNDTSLFFSQSVDGARVSTAEYTTVADRLAFEAKLEFVFSPDEALFGLGSHEEGYGNLRGRYRELYQQNMKAVVPYFVSTRGYGVLLDCCSLMTFRDDALGSYWWADVVDALDFYLIQGDSFDDVTRGYHRLTGSVPMLPKWAFGFMQSKERYVNAEELVANVAEYRRRRIPLDTIVLDWKSWPNGSGWGQKTFDPIRFPDPAALTTKLHSLGAHLMVSIWPIMTGNCDDQQQMLDRGLMLGNQSVYNAFDPEARALYWSQANRGIFSHGVDAWWCDCTEPFEADWKGAVKPEPHIRLAINTEESKRYLDPAMINAYSLLHSQGIYEGQRSTSSDKRVVNLTRSTYAGQHRYSTITWNGDVSATWETLRRSIPEGVHFCAAGEPYWTVDAGGFFIGDDPKLWFWSGDYTAGCRGLTDANALQPDPNDTGCSDLGYFELYTRWMQYAAFLPVFRAHGTDAAREIWRFGDQGEMFYDAIAKCIALRYRLLPYIYSLAAQVTFHSVSMLRAVALDFPDDIATHSLTDQYLFGRAMMVCPVTQPMYFGPNSRPIVHAETSRSVYLPRGASWFNFWTRTLHHGGQALTVDAPIHTISLFIRAGSILPMTQVMQYVGEVPEAPYEIRVYTGADAAFTLYEDDDDGYGYERGAFSLVHFRWNNTLGELTLSAREGRFSALLEERELCILFFTHSGCELRNVRYRGKEVRIHAASQWNEDGR